VTRNYLDSHKVQDHIQNLIQDVLRAQPADPYRYMLQSLRKERASQEAARIATPAGTQEGDAVAQQQMQAKTPAPLAPKPPEGPNTRGSLRKQNAKVTPEGQQQSNPEAAPEAAAAKAPLVPKPPDQPPPGGSPRKARPSGGSKEVISPPAKPTKGISEERIMARTSIGMLFLGPRVALEVEQSLREKEQQSFSAAFASQVVSKTRNAIGAKKQKDIIDFFGAPREVVRSEARGSILTLYKTSAQLLEPENRRAIVKWTVNLAIRSAAVRIGNDQEKRQQCYRRMSAPTPIVNLDTSTSWAAILGSK